MRASADRATQRGVVLIIVLVWLTVMTLLAVSGAQIGLQEKKALRNFRDREIAFHAAEAGLLDGEIDLDTALVNEAARSTRSAMFSPSNRTGFPRAEEALCHSGEAHPQQGLCRMSADADQAAWVVVDLAAFEAGVPVRYGRFTGRTMATAAASLPSRLPRYLIELLPDPKATDTAIPRYVYRVTAIGFGAQSDNQVVLQSLYRKGDDSVGAAAPSAGSPLRVGRLSWREIGNWRELHEHSTLYGKSP